MIVKEFQIFSVIILMIYSPLINGFCSDSINSIDNKFRLIKLHYENLSGEKGLTTFFYNEKGIMHEAHWELLDGSRSSDNYYTYNEEENLIMKYRKFSDGITSTQIYEYDENGNLISEHFNRSDGITGTTDYKYDKYGKLVKANCNGLAGWFYGVITYEYDDKNLKNKGAISKDGKLIGNIYYEYDDEGNLLKEHWVFIESWSQTFIYEYEELNCY
jgi:hypothetical protein